MKHVRNYDVLGIGSPIIDHIIRVDEIVETYRERLLGLIEKSVDIVIANLKIELHDRATE